MRNDRYVNNRKFNPGFKRENGIKHEPLARIDEVAKEYGVPASTARNWWNKKGLDIQCIYIARKGVMRRYYNLKKLRQWMQERISESGKSYAKKM